MKNIWKELAGQIGVILTVAPAVLARLEDGEAIAKQGGAFGDTKNDTELKADVLLGQHFRDQLSEVPGIARITVEGMKVELLQDTSMDLWATVDPIDGSLNYKLRRGSQGLPYSACITVLKKSMNATFDDVVVAGVIDLRNADIWLAWREEDGYHTTLNGVPVRTMDAVTLDIGSQIVIGEFYYQTNRAAIVHAFDDVKGWIRNPGSAAYEMALVASGTAVAFICGTQKQHELGAAYALVKGAGGVTVDFDGNDLGSREYDFKTQTPVVLAANKTISAQVCARLKR